MDALEDALRVISSFSVRLATPRTLYRMKKSTVRPIGVIDEAARKAAIRWVCQHDFTQAVPRVRRLLFTALYGSKAGWYGTDIFHFDEQGKIVGKFSYANYGRPQLRRDLGASP